MENAPPEVGEACGDDRETTIREYLRPSDRQSVVNSILVD